MLVQDIMTRNVVAIDPDMPISDVNILMEQRNIRHFPILENNRLVGIVSDRDIRLVGSAHPRAPQGIGLKDPVRHLMVFPILTAHPLDPIEESAKVLRNHKIGALPVVENEELVGIVTGIDLLEALVKMTGVYEAGSRLEVELPNQPTSLASLLSDIATLNIGVSSVMTTKRDGAQTCYALRVTTIDARGLARKLMDEGHDVLWPLEKD